MNKAVKMKLLYIIATLAALAMLIPAAVPVSAGPDEPYLEMYIIDPLTDEPSVDLDGGHNITGSVVRVVPVDLGNATVTGWNITNYLLAGGVIEDSAIGAEGVAFADVRGGYGEATIWAELSEGPDLSIDKKWGQIAGTEFDDDAQDIPMTWNETGKYFFGGTSVTDTVTGVFMNKDAETIYEDMEGVILNWYLVAGWEDPPTAPGKSANLKDYVEDLDEPDFTWFTDNGETWIRTTTPESGSVTVDIEADGEETVYVVVIPEYPGSGLQVDVTPEIATINFYSYEMEKTPQVRWAGEKIVLEKFFGTEWTGYPVRFSLENQSAGALEGIPTTYPSGNFPGLNIINTQATVWSVVDIDGYARCMFVSEAPGEIDIDLAVYEQIEGQWSIVNQHGFVVYYLKLEEVTLGNVSGKRAGHFDGPWTPPNPWDSSTDIPADPYDFAPGANVDILNVSQDALLRARVKGWFMGDNLSNRPARAIDSNGNGIIDIHDTVLPEGRWVLPDDWPYLAGPEWIENRLHWDIMDAPNDDIIADYPEGFYYKDMDLDNDYDAAPHGMYPADPIVACADVVVPFRPGLELPTYYGYDPEGLGEDKYIDEETVVPNGNLDSWDAPMPPAKITFKILDPDVTANSNDDYHRSPIAPEDTGISDHAGFFKSAEKWDIYYLPDLSPDALPGEVVFTNPGYWAEIPAFEQIPAFVNNGGYDWNSWDEDYGHYAFWWIINRPLNEVVSSTDTTNYPTKAQVYSDNHGEAMVYLNGDFNLNLWPWFYETDTVDIPQGELVATSTVVAIADYPYFRKHVPLVSNEVEKDWTWGGEIRGTDAYLAPDFEITPVQNRMILAVGENVEPFDEANPVYVMQSNKLMVFLWLTDRDNLPFGVEDAMIEWSIEGSGSVVDITGNSGTGISKYNYATLNIGLQNGFLAGTDGIITDAPNDVHGLSGVKRVYYDEDNLYDLSKTSPEAMVFKKFWPTLDPNNYVVAGVELITSDLAATAVVHAEISSTDYGVYPGLVGELDRYITAEFAVTHELDDIPLYGDANVDGVINMGDVTAVERTILGLMDGYVGADANGDTEIDMGDVVKIERIILGLD